MSLCFKKLHYFCMATDACQTKWRVAQIAHEIEQSTSVWSKVEEHLDYFCAPPRSLAAVHLAALDG